MTKDVWISIESLQKNAEGESEKIEIITPASYYKKNGRHYVLYEETLEDGIVSKNTLRFDDDFVSVTKRGDVSVDMVFEKGKRNTTNYATPYGSLLVGIEASKLEVLYEETSISINVEYSLDINYEHLSDCVISMKIRSKTEDEIEKMHL